MDYIENLIEDIWFGEKTNVFKEEMNNNALNKKERIKLLNLINNFKQGDFSKKEELCTLLNTSEDKDVLNVAIRLFIAIASNEDFSRINDFLCNAEEESVSVFIAFAEESLSYNIIPSLLGLLSIWEDTAIEADICQTIGSIIGYERATYEICSEDELGEEFVKFCKDKNLSEYYFENKLAFIGDWTKELVEITMSARYKECELEEYTLPSILSKYSGIKCPVEYYTKIDDNAYREVIEYIKKISKMTWEKGCKYFYGNKIE
ncbi:MAG: Imm47 family immunity protein [Clostridium butyricum]|nr:Imm47 family immunity protein [Clostridium butyricum]